MKGLAWYELPAMTIRRETKRRPVSSQGFPQRTPKIISLETLNFEVFLLDKLKRRAPRICKGLASEEAVTLIDSQEFQSSSLSSLRVDETEQFMSLDATERSNLGQWRIQSTQNSFPHSLITKRWIVLNYFSL